MMNSNRIHHYNIIIATIAIKITLLQEETSKADQRRRAAKMTTLKKDTSREE
jgi:hypothetical protein